MSDDHNKHLKAHIVAGRQCGKSWMNYVSLTAGVVSAHALAYKKQMTVTDWCNRENISEDDLLAYPNARTAYEIQQSPLAKALA